MSDASWTFISNEKKGLIVLGKCQRQEVLVFGQDRALWNDLVEGFSRNHPELRGKGDEMNRIRFTDGTYQDLPGAIHVDGNLFEWSIKQQQKLK